MAAARGNNRFLEAASSTLSLLVAGGAAVAAAAAHSLPLLALGAAAYGALVAWDLTTRRKPVPFEKLPDPRRLRDPDARRAVESLLESQRALAAVLQESPDAVARYLEMALGTASELEDRAGRLALRQDELSQYLAGADAKAVQRALESLRAQAARTADAEARAQFAEAAAARETQLQTLQELRDARDRVAGHLSRIVATYEALPARVVHMRALDAQAADAAGGDLGQDLDRVNHEIAAFEETLKTLSEKVKA